MEAEWYKTTDRHLLTCPGDHGNQPCGDGAIAHSLFCALVLSSTSLLALNRT